MIPKTNIFTILCLCCQYFYMSESGDICREDRIRGLGYIKIREIDKCLLFSMSMLSWQRASQRCVALGGQLYTARHVSQLLQEYLIPYNFRHEDYWIGLNDIEREGEFRWNLKPKGEQELGISSVDLLPWREGQPDNVGGQEDCVMKSRDGTWRDEPCSKRLRYICETVKRDSLESAELSIEDAVNEETRGQSLVTIIIVLAIVLAVIPAAIHLFTKARLNKNKNKAEEANKDETSFDSAVTSDSGDSSTASSPTTSNSPTASVSPTSDTLRTSTSNVTQSQSVVPSKPRPDTVPLNPGSKRKVAFRADEPSEETSSISSGALESM